LFDGLVIAAHAHGGSRKPIEAERYMAEVAARRNRFDRLASRLNETVIQPRLETLAGYFSNVSLAKDEPAGRCPAVDVVGRRLSSPLKNERPHRAATFPATSSVA
jgi:hypothetical protein